MVFGFISEGLSKIRKTLQSTRELLQSKLSKLFTRKIDETVLEELEEILFEADLGGITIKEILANMRENAKNNPSLTLKDALLILEKGLLSQSMSLNHSLHFSETAPTIIVIVGANGSGKTTSIAKLAHLYKEQGKKILFAAADTFRAAAQDQLDVWASRLGIETIHGGKNADPAAVTFDAIHAAQARGIDIVFIDTAGRLENKHHLMQELEKINKACKKCLPDSPHEVLMVIDGTIGQNGIEQAKSFHRALGVTGLIVTKLDGSAKGGAVIAIEKMVNIPVKYVGIGEQLDTLIPFDPEAFVHSLLYEEGS